MESIPRLYELNEPISEEQMQLGTFDEQLKNLQGNILQGHAREHCLCIFLTFKEGQEDKVREWIRDLSHGITDAKKIYNEIKRYGKNRNQCGDLFMGFYLSAAGYDYLKIGVKNKFKFSTMSDSSKYLKDPETEKKYDKKFHAMIMLAYHNQETLNNKKEEIYEHLMSKDLVEKEHKNGEEIFSGFVEVGKVIRKEDKVVEHFGYVDGVSQPLFFKNDFNRKGATSSNFDPFIAPKHVLVEDINIESKGYSGSYLVFRKLEQNVHKFKKEEERLAKKLGLEEHDRRAEALIIGRFRDGTPLTLSREPTGNSKKNNFNYDHDDQGLKCPLHAHIRKMNTRHNQSFNTKHLIVRRGITYDDREDQQGRDAEAHPFPEKDVGILFMCYQKDIKNGFEFLQAEWANDAYTPRARGRSVSTYAPGEASGNDPVINNDKDIKRQSWPKEWGTGEKDREFTFERCVTLKMGEYFFAPSKHFLRNL